MGRGHQAGRGHGADRARVHPAGPPRPRLRDCGDRGGEPSRQGSRRRGGAALHRPGQPGEQLHLPAHRLPAGRGPGDAVVHPARLGAVTEIDLTHRIAAELSVRDHQVAAAVELLDGGATVPFIARYRKEATGALDDTQLRTLDERLRYLRELEERRAAVLASITEQGKLTDELRAQLESADTKARLEDLYLPYKPQRRTKAQIARENGLEPLADLLLSDPDRDPATEAVAYLGENVPDETAALDGARAILVERFAEDADLIGTLRERMWSRGVLRAKVRAGKEEAGRKYSDYFDFS